MSDSKERRAKCDLCGKFRNANEVAGMSGDSDDTGNYDEWRECVYCMSPSERRHFGFNTTAEQTLAEFKAKYPGGGV